MTMLTPAQIVAELDRYIVGQDDAKRVVAIALRDRWRRQQLTGDLRDEVRPKNILMVGPTGVGKTEIARRVARIINAPFLKVEATTYTEVGYVGRDVDSIIRDLIEVAVSIVQCERLEAVREQATEAATERLLDLLVRRDTQQAGHKTLEERELPVARTMESSSAKRAASRRRNRYAKLLRGNQIDDMTVEIDVQQRVEVYSPHVEIVSGVSADALHHSLHELFESMAGPQEPRSMTVGEARKVLAQQEAERLINLSAIEQAAIERVEESGVVFIDEIDKTIHENADYGPDVSGGGVQRDLLPIVEGSVVMTRHGPVRTDNILFIAAGSFSSTRPSDLIPELLGRFPLRVELSSLDEDDLLAILSEPENALTRQYVALLGTEGITVAFSDDGMEAIAHAAAEMNNRAEDIGARRLVTVMERVLEDLSFEAPEHAGQSFTIDAEFVTAKLGDLGADDDLSDAIL